MPDPSAVAVAYVEAFATADPHAVAALVTEGFVNEHTAALGSGCEGRDEYRRRLPGFLAAFEGLRYEVEDVVADGPKVSLAYTMRAVSEGHPVEIRGVMRIVVDGDLVARRTDYWDALTYLRQVGQA